MRHSSTAPNFSPTVYCHKGHKGFACLRVGHCPQELGTRYEKNEMWGHFVHSDPYRGFYNDPGWCQDMCVADDRCSAFEFNYRDYFDDTPHDTCTWWGTGTCDLGTAIFDEYPWNDKRIVCQKGVLPCTVNQGRDRTAVFLVMLRLHTASTVFFGHTATRGGCALSRNIWGALFSRF